MSDQAEELQHSQSPIEDTPLFSLKNQEKPEVGMTDARINAIFNGALEEIGALEFLSGTIAPSKDEPQPADYPEDEIWDPEDSYTRWFLKNESTSHELEDPYVYSYLQHITALRIYADKQLQQYKADKKYIDVLDTDPVKIAIETSYRTTSLEVFEETQKKFKGKYFYDDEYSRVPYIVDLDHDKYSQLAERLAAHFNTHPDLGVLVEKFKNDPSFRKIRVVYRERVDVFVEQMDRHSIEANVPILEAMEDEYRDYILSLYPDQQVTIPKVVYIPFEKSGEWETLLKINPHRSLWNHIVEPKILGGSYISETHYSGQTIPLELTYLLVSNKRKKELHAEALFEEMYHSTTKAFRTRAAKEGFPIPGLNGKDFLEEAITGVESYYFFKRFHPDFLSESATETYSLSRLLQGEKDGVKRLGEIPAAIMLIIAEKNGGENFLPLLRKARSQDMEAVGKLQQIMDAALGPGSFSHMKEMAYVQDEERALQYLNSLLIS